MTISTHFLDFLDDPDEGHLPLDPDVDDAEGGPDAARVRRRRTPRLNPDGLALVAAGAVRLESARRGLTQQDLAGALGISRTAGTDRPAGPMTSARPEVPFHGKTISPRVRRLPCRHGSCRTDTLKP